MVLVLAIALLGVVGVGSGSSRGEAASTSVHFGPARPLGSAAKATPFRAGVVLVGFRAGVSAPAREAATRAAGAWGARRLGPVIKPVGHGAAAGGEYTSPFLVHVPANGELAAVRRLRSQSAVAYAEPNYTLSATAIPNDSSFSVQWADRNTGQPVLTQEINEILGAAATGTAGADDGAFKAWQLSTGSRSIVIGEADTGVDYTHPDLAANIWTNPGHIGGCPKGTHGFNVKAQTCDPMDLDT
ncbi:MAG TPA: hypothetical protein VNZ05_04260, partial [Solirubrobacteraceae bacterium]|nr:hypothetical protein [Solirubrobacteraceae bacterium]